MKSKTPVVKIIKRHNVRAQQPESNENRQRNSESDFKKAVESWIHEFKRRRP